MASTAATVSARENGSAVSSVLPDSIFDISSTSLMSPSRCLPDRAILRLYSRTASSWPASRSISSENPRMAFMGVRMSWLMEARKLLFARLASSAAATESMRRWRISCSSVMSVSE